MPRISLMLLWLLLAAAPAFSAAADKPVRKPSPAPSRIRVYAAIPPLAFLAARVGGAWVEARALVKPGRTPHSYFPSARQLARLSAARLYFRLGLPFEERLLEKIRRLNPGLELIDVRPGVKRRYFGAGSVHHHGQRHEDGEGENEGGPAPDPHLWLSPLNAATIAANICAALRQADPVHRESYRKNLAGLQRELRSVHEQVKRRLVPHKGKTLLVYHPSFGYFTDAYGLRQRAVEAGGKAPRARQLARLLAAARREGARAIFVQPQFSRKSAALIARSLGGRVIVLDPLARDLLANFESMAEKIATAPGFGAATSKSPAGNAAGER